VPAVQRIIATAYDQYAPMMPASLFAAYLDDLLAVAPRMATADVLVAWAGDEPVGTVTSYADGATLGMGWPSGWPTFRALGVTPGRRSRGCGRALVDACVERAAAAGAPALGLHTATFMAAAVQLYERRGFVRDPDRDVTPAALLDVGDVGGADLPAVIAYRLDLDAAAGVAA
jgi:GNAT superfamily N-acetyltransferase